MTLNMQGGLQVLNPGRVTLGKGLVKTLFGRNLKGKRCAFAGILNAAAGIMLWTEKAFSF